MKPRVLILTAGYGEGHNAAARALAAACDARHGAGTARLVDVFEVVAPRFSRISRRAYIGMINTLPRVWSAVLRLGRAARSGSPARSGCSGASAA
jgi:processive 1,2-diacylglycerol beta-glucosyltransferase